MHIKFSNTGGGQASGLAEYLLRETDSKNEIRAGITVLKGDPHSVAQVAESLEFKNTHKHAIIAFAPDDKPTDEEINAVLEDFEKVAFAGLDQDRYSWTAVQHDEAEGVHLHIMIANCDLETGKHLNVAPPGWKKWTSLVRDKHNELNDWLSPDIEAHPENAQTLQPSKGSLKNTHHAKNEITKHIEKLVVKGLVSNREDVLDALSDFFEIKKVGKSYITVREKDKPESKGFRLKGSIYEQEFRAERIIENENARRSGVTSAADDSKLSDYKKRINEVIGERSDYVQKRYKKIHEGRGEADKASGAAKERDGAGKRAASGMEEKRGQINRMASFSDTHTDDDGLIDELLLSLRSDGTKGNKANARQGNQGDSAEILRQQAVREDRGETLVSGRLQDLKAKVGLINDGTRNDFTERAGRIISTTRETDKRLALGSARIKEGRKEVQQSLHANSGIIERGIKKVRENRADEINDFKAKINLAAYMCSKGYKVDKSESSRNSIVLRKGQDKLIVSTATDGHGIYFSVRDDQDNGSIIDFIQKRENMNIGQVRRELRPSLGLRPEIKYSIKKPVAADKNTQQVIHAYSKTLSLSDGGYLSRKRGISANILDDSRFSSMVREDKKGNVIFPHYNNSGLCGYELKNDAFTGFSKSGQKSVWHSSNLGSSKKLVVCESAIDCLSHAQLHPDIDTAYISVAGSLSQAQEEIIGRVIASYREKGLDVISATDADAAGNEFQEAFKAMGANLKHQPLAGDWNDALIDQLRLEQDEVEVEVEQDYPRC